MNEVELKEVGEKKAKRRWRRVLVGVVLFVVLVFVGWGAVATSLVRSHDAKLKRDATTGILAGAEPRELGPENAPGAVLFIHGFNGCPNNYHDFPDQVAAAGWRVKAMLLPGHGTTPLEFEKQSADTLLDAALAEVDALKAKYKKVVVVGHSMGGAIATLVASKRDIDGVVLCGPYYGLKQQWFYPIAPERLAKLVSPVLQWVKGIEGQQPITDKSQADKIISYNWVTIQGALSGIELGERARQPEVLESIDMPVLLINGLKDSLTTYETSAAAVAKMPSAVKKECVLEEADHVLFWDFGQEKASAALLEFLGGLKA